MVFKLVFVDWVHFSKVSNELLLSISLIWSEKPTHFIYQNKNSIITNERTDLSFSGGKVPKWQGSTCQSMPQNHKHNLYFHLNRCPFSLWTIANWSLRSTHAQIHKNIHTKTLCFLFNWEIRFVFVWLSNHPKCRFGNHIQVVGVSWEKKPLSLMFKVKIIRNFSSIIRAENERDTWFYEIQLFTIMRDSSVHQDLLINSNQIKSIVSIPNLDDFSKYSHVQYFPLFCSHSIRLAWLFFSSSL